MPTIDDIFDNPTGWLKPKRIKHTHEPYVGRRWVDLEFEEQAAVRSFMRQGLLRIEGRGGSRRVAATKEVPCINPRAREAGWGVAFCPCQECADFYASRR